MKFDSEKVNKLLYEMEVIRDRIKETVKEFHRKLAKNK